MHGRTNIKFNTPRPLFTLGKDPVPTITGGWVGPRAGLDRYGKSRSHRDSIPGPSSPYPVAIPTELPGPRTSYVVKKFNSQPVGNRKKI